MLTLIVCTRAHTPSHHKEYITLYPQVNDFSAYTNELWERFRATGPGLPTIELAHGLDALHEFAAELESAIKQREALVLAEKLFDMEITSYPLLAQLEGEMKKLQQIYAVYAEHAEAVRQYASMLWGELDVGKMMASTEEISNKLRKLKQFKLMPTYELVEREIQGFHNSLPLMKELKSDALRWGLGEAVLRAGCHMQHVLHMSASCGVGGHCTCMLVPVKPSIRLH